MVAYAAPKGIYRHKYYLTLQQAELGLLVNTVGEGIVGISETFGKVAISLLLIRLMGRTSKWRRWFLWVLIALTVIICIITVFITFFQCRNPQAVWNIPLQATTTCWDKSVLTNEALFCSCMYSLREFKHILKPSAWFTAVDFILALFPLTIVYNLKMSLRRKIALAVLLGLGVM